MRRPGHAPTASRSPTAPRTGPVMAIDGDPTTAWRGRRPRRTRSASSMRLDVAEPIDHLTLRQPTGAAAVRHLGARHDRRRRAARRSVVDARRAARSPAASASTSTRPTGPSTVTITIDSRRRPRSDPRPGAGRRRVRRGRHRARRRRVEVVRAAERRRRRPRRRRRRHAGVVRASPGCAPARPTAGAPIPSRRWCASSTCRPTRPFDARRSPCASTSGPTDAVLAELLGIDRAAGRSAGSPARRRRPAGRLADGDPATAWTTPFSGAVGATRRP